MVLSIGKLGAGQADYYLDREEGRVDPIESLEGAEEYYLGRGEAAGVWMGAGSAHLGLPRDVDGAQLRAVLAGLDPRDGSVLRSARGGVRVVAFDLTFSAPKSVSVLFGVGERDVRVSVRQAHDRAVREALAYLEGSAASVRRGAAGVEVMQADGLVAAAFRHRTSRVGDPQLHTHLLVANLARGADGRWSALDGRRLYAHARTASFVYQAVLRGELTHTLGVEWTPVQKGIAEIVGVPAEAMGAFSRRRAEITAAMERRGTSGPRAAEVAALATRRPKGDRVTAEALAGGWQRRAAALGLDAHAISALMDRTLAPELDRGTWLRTVAGLIGPGGLTLRRSAFSRREVIQALCDRLPAGARLDARLLERAAEAVLHSREVVPLMPKQAGESFRRRDGRLVPVLRGELTYSTTEHLAVEQRLIERVRSGHLAGAGAVASGPVAAAMRARPTLSDEQRAMIESLCRDGTRVAVVAGHAGTGKTFALAAARDGWEAAGHPVLGAAIARRAARELETGAGIRSTSVAALLAGLERRPLPARCVLVLDEAGMVPTRQLASLLDHVERVDGKLVLVGDHRQLPELEAGGAFHGLVRRGLAIELTENLRQVQEWEREALEHLRTGRVESALASYTAHDRVHIHADGADARAAVVRDWWAAGDLDGAVMIAHRRADVADLNRRARDCLQREGALGREHLRLPGGRIAAGDHVVVKTNDLRRGIHNGDRARVVAIDRRHQALELDCHGRLVTLDADFLHGETARGEPTLLHGYAITGHVAQGMTVDRAYVLADPGLTGEWAYTAMSRGRQHNAIYFAADRDDTRGEFAPRGLQEHTPLERLTTALASSEASTLAIDTGTPAAPDLRREIQAARNALATARAERQRAEGRRLAWRPSVRADVDVTRQAETAAGRQLGELRVRVAEQDARRVARTESTIVATQRVLEAAQTRRATRRQERDFGIER
jgi:conjugative relaxase-like TrwC/TraI family protein